MQFFTKRKMLIIGLAGSGIIGLLLLLSVTPYCRQIPSCLDFFVTYDPWYWATLIFAAPFLLFFSLLTYWLPDRVFGAWKFFAVLATPVVAVLTYIISNMPDGMLFHPGLIYLPLLYGAFFLGSLIVISVAWYRGRGASMESSSRGTRNNLK